jgi:hypothetical protein
MTIKAKANFRKTNHKQSRTTLKNKLKNSKKWKQQNGHWTRHIQKFISK